MAKVALDYGFICLYIVFTHMKKGLFAEIPATLYARVLKAARKHDLKLKAIVCQALLMWLKEHGA